MTSHVVSANDMGTNDLLTLSQFAEGLAPRDAAGALDQDRLKLWTRRLRHWSRLGILPIVRQRNQTGSHRLYRTEDLYLASVLVRLAGPGLSHSTLSLISDELQAQTKQGGRLHKFWKDAQTHAKGDDPTHQYFLLIWIAHEGTFIWSAGEIFRGRDSDSTLDFNEIGPEDEPTLLLSLTNIFRNLLSRA